MPVRFLRFLHAGLSTTQDLHVPAPIASCTRLNGDAARTADGTEESMGVQKSSGKDEIEGPRGRLDSRLRPTTPRIHRRKAAVGRSLPASCRSPMSRRDPPLTLRLSQSKSTPYALRCNIGPPNRGCKWISKSQHAFENFSRYLFWPPLCRGDCSHSSMKPVSQGYCLFRFPSSGCIAWPDRNSLRSNVPT